VRLDRKYNYYNIGQDGEYPELTQKDKNKIKNLKVPKRGSFDET